jgi:hypothetical protein
MENIGLGEGDKKNEQLFPPSLIIFVNCNQFYEEQFILKIQNTVFILYT